MKKILLSLLLMVSGLIAFGQSDSTRLRKMAEEAVIQRYEKELQISNEKAKQLSYILSKSVLQMKVSGTDKKSGTEEKRRQFERIAAERDKAIRQLLSEEEYVRLTKMLQSYKTSLKKP